MRLGWEQSSHSRIELVKSGNCSDLVGFQDMDPFLTSGSNIPESQVWFILFHGKSWGRLGWIWSTLANSCCSHLSLCYWSEMMHSWRGDKMLFFNIFNHPLFEFGNKPAHHDGSNRIQNVYVVCFCYCWWWCVSLCICKDSVDRRIEAARLVCTELRVFLRITIAWFQRIILWIPISLGRISDCFMLDCPF